MPNRIKVLIIIISTVAILLVACANHPAYYHEADAYVMATYTHTPTPTYTPLSPTPSPEPFTDPTPPSKIAILTHSSFQPNTWVDELTGLHGITNIIIHTHPRHDSPPAAAENIVNQIAANPDIRMLIVNPVTSDTDYKISMLCQQRDDIFIIYIGYNPAWPTPTNAHLVLEMDILATADNFVRTAKYMGASTLAYFYDSASAWEQVGNDFIQVEYVESDKHILMREVSQEVGLNFVEVDIDGAMQCGSSTAMFMHDTLPPLVENYGPGIVFHGLCNERLLWSLNMGAIYIPMYPSWFATTPEHIAHELSITATCNVELVGQVKTALAERVGPGRVASFPMPPGLLMPLAAAEYGAMWIHGDVAYEGVELDVLQRIMARIIAQHIGDEHDVRLEASHGNHVLVEIGYLVY